jgi:hypothetical protein
VAKTGRTHYVRPYGSGAPFPAKKYSMTTVSNAVCPTSLPQSADALPLYLASPWIQKNTLADIVYLFSPTINWSGLI